MPSPSFVCTRILLWVSWTLSLPFLARNFVNFVALFALRMRLEIFQRNMQPVSEKSSEIRQRQQQIILPLTNTVTVPKGPNHHWHRSRHKFHSPKNLVSPYRSGRLVTHNSFKAKRRMFSLSTYKLHSLGDYVQTIRALGATDSYSTQTVSLLKLYHTETLI
jgi:hypothetical protein